MGKVSQILTPKRMNFDSDLKLLKPDEARRIVNLRTHSTEGGNVGSNENIKGTMLINNPYFEIGDVGIKSVEDIETNTLIWFIYNPDPNKHKIIRYTPGKIGTSLIMAPIPPPPMITPEIELVLKHKYLNFQLNQKIKSAKVIDGMLYWTDGYFGSFENNDFNSPRKLNIDKAIKFTQKYYGNQRRDVTWIRRMEINGVVGTLYLFNGSQIWKQGDKVVTWINEGDSYGHRMKLPTGYGVVTYIGVLNGKNYIITDRPWLDTTLIYTKTGHILPYEADMYYGIDFQTLDQIKYQPEFPPRVSYTTDASVKTNNLRNNLFQFKTRWVFDDKEKSTCSSISAVPFPSRSEYLNGAYDYLSVSDNMINVWMDSGSMEVKTIELFVRNGNKGKWGLIKRIHKYDPNGACVMPNDILILYGFTNSETRDGVVDDEINKPFDFLPQIASSQELFEKNRFIIGDFYEGYDNVPVDVKLYPKTYPQNVYFGSSVFQFIKDPGYEAWSSPASDYPMYSKGIAWWWSNYPYPNTTYPKQPLTYGCAVIDLAKVPLLLGAQYILEIVSSFKYENSEDPDVMHYPPQWLNDTVVATAIAIGNGDLRSIINQLCEQLRSSTAALGYSAIGFCNRSYGNFSNHIWGDWDRQGLTTHEPHYQLTRDSELGVVLTHGGWGTVDLDLINIKLTIIQNIAKYPTFKSGFPQQYGQVYFDEAGRCGAVNTSPLSRINVPLQTELSLNHTHAPFVNNIRWEIFHRPPMWAATYKWLRVINKSYSVQCPLISISTLQGLGEYVGPYMGLDIMDNFMNTGKGLLKFNIKPYEWVSGDRVRFLYKSQMVNFAPEYKTFPVNLDFEILGVIDATGADSYLSNDIGDPILDAEGNKQKNPALRRLVIQSFDFLFYFSDISLSLNIVVVEIYRPPKITDSAIYCEQSEELAIINPHTQNRYHQGSIRNVDPDPAWNRNQSGSQSARGVFLSGDAYLIARYMRNYLFSAVFPSESPSYSDWYDSEEVDIGRPNSENTLMRRNRFDSGYRFSGVLIQETQVNELSRYDSDNLDILSDKYGRIYGIIGSGDVLRVIQRSRCTSIYVGKSGIKQAASPGQGDILATVDSVLGSKYIHPDTYGTVFSESIISVGNFDYFFDIYNQTPCRWSTNGIKQISGKDSETGWDFGMLKYFRDKSRALLESGIENVNVYSTFEKEFGNLIITFVDRINVSNNETVIFHEPSNSWAMFARFIPENYGSLGLILTSSLSGKLWRHNVNPIRNNFYGVQYDSEVEIVMNEKPADNKVFDSMEIISFQDWESPNTGDILVLTDGVSMKSRLKKERFKAREGKKIAAYPRDMFTSGKEKLNDLINGRPLRGKALTQRLVNSSTEEALLFAIKINATISE